MNIYTQNTDYENGLYNLLMKGVKENNIKLDNPEVTLFMIVELVSSTCVTSILDKKPLPIKEYKPILFKEIRKMINCNEDDSSSNKTKK
jgi:hypothetical protein